MKSNVIAFSANLSRGRAPIKKTILTEQRVQDLKASGATIYVHDARMPGLSIRITRAGVKSYVFTKKVNRRLLRITLGKTAAMTLEAARKAASAYHGDIARGIDVAAARKAAKAAAAARATTLADAYEGFMAAKDRRPSTQKDYKMLWRLHIPSSLKGKPIADITGADIEKLKTEIGRTKRRTANKMVVLLASIMSKAGRWADNPARGIERYEESVRTRRLKGEELSRLWEALDDADTSRTLWAEFFKILIVTGARRTALCAMRWEDLDLDAGVWVVPAIWSKNRREMAIPLTTAAVDVLQRRFKARSRSPWVWPSAKAEGGARGQSGETVAGISEGSRDRPTCFAPRCPKDARVQPCKIGCSVGDDQQGAGACLAAICSGLRPPRRRARAVGYREGTGGAWSCLVNAGSTK
jgi:integrase